MAGAGDIPPVRPSLFGEALGWSPGEPINLRTLAIAVLGMGAPALIGIAAHQAEIGFTIGLGAMLLADTPNTGTAAGASQNATNPGSSAAPGAALLPAALAVSFATLLAGEPWSDPAMIVLAGAAAAFSGYSRPIGVAAIRFIVYLILSFTVLQNAGEHRGSAALVFGIGALWNVVIRLLVVRRSPKAMVHETADPSDAPLRMPTAAQRRASWRRTMGSLIGWQFTVRVVVGLALADGVRLAFPAHHYGWIVLTVALLTQRPIEHLPVKLLQRTGGTLAGVLVTWGILALAPPPLAIGLTICSLAAAAYLARTRNYLLYACLSTPVILLVLDLGKPIQAALLADRVIATVIGAAIVIALNLLLDRLTAVSGGARTLQRPLTPPPARRPTAP